ncbi:hypothetical protein B0H16DRAFT_390545 [Mycena metata]|uniref:Uncharacterized protein n=1 Tax=Mycena metata TaxID=1033252 RepID=A0AAD7MJA2_9AGAR|nr:hypothetical protein B0H16DRAFT_390545 [Mycena metata]
MPLVAAALTFGSFGDILEAAKIAKRIIDVLRRGGGSCERLRLISTLQHICDYMSQLTVLPDASLTTRLRDQVGLCCSLLDQFHKKIKSQESFLGRRWMVALEERELTSWRVQISEHRDALRGLLGPITILQLHDVGEQLGRVGSQVQYVGSRIDNVKAHIQHEVGTLGVLIETHLSAATSRMGSGIRGVATDIQTVQQAIHKILPRNISDPFFYVRSPLGHPFRFPPIRVLMISIGF